MFRYVKLVTIFAGASISAQLEYRANFVVSLLGAMLGAGGALFGLNVLAGDGTLVGGWSYREAVVVVGLFTIVQGFIGALLYPNLNKIAEAVRTGQMDFTLLKPIDAQFLVSSRNVNIFPLINVLVGIGLVAWAISGIGASAVNILLGALLMSSALAIVYAIWFMLTTTAFWFVRVENITELFNGMFRAGQFPVTVFPGWIRIFFTFVVPVAFITTVPAEALIGRVNPAAAATAVGVALLLLILARLFWRWAVSSYTSASS